MKKSTALGDHSKSSILAVCCLIGATIFSLATASAQQPLKVDFTMPGRPNAVDPNFTPWAVPTAVSASSNFNGITVTVSNIGPWGLGLKSGWWKDGAESPTMNARMISDGITVDSVDNRTNDGARVEMRLSGLAPGTHTLLTYHNAWDNPTNPPPVQLFSKMNVFLNGEQVHTNLQPTVRATNNYSGAVAFLKFEVVSDEDVVIWFEADRTSEADNYTNVWINGFELDTGNLSSKALFPTPANNDEHVDGDSKTVLLRWLPAASAVSHNVYIGTSSNAVFTATTDSPEFRGNQSDTNFLLTNVSSLVTYYWRIDEILDDGIEKGELWTFRTRHLAFPGAEGYGRFARGGRGGRVIEVTNLNDNGSGSLREALEADGPRTIVFAVSGLITLESRLTIRNPYFTLAGQTAPGKGICVRGAPLGMSGAKDGIIRHIRVRVGSGRTYDGMGMQGSDHCIIDHCSISWSIDEVFSSRSGRNITLQKTLISEALNIAGHQNYPPGTRHGYAASISGDIGSFHHNLLAHCYGRNWSLAGGLDGAGFFAGRLDIFNNVVYNWGGRTTDGGAHQVNFVNNYYKPGAASSTFYALNAQYDNFPGTQQYYFAGNVMPGRFDESNQSAGRRASGNVPTTYSPWVDAPFFPSHATIQPAREAYKIVLSDVGCTQPAIDNHDVRIINETLSGTYTYTGTGPYGGDPGMPNSESDVGGWEDYPVVYRPANFDSDHDGLPDWWENIKGLNPNSPPGDFSDSNADPDGDEYTNLEDYLNWMAEPHVDGLQNASLEVDLQPLARGFETNPVFRITSAVNGTVTLLADGRTARFTPTYDFSGLANFTFSVSNAPLGVMTRTIGIYVEPALKWTGAASADWDTTTENWVRNGSGVVYTDGMSVHFDDSAASGNVNLAMFVSPAGTTFDNDALVYTLTGTGSIGGNGGLTKSGSSTVVLANAMPNTFSGRVLINRGTLQVGTGSSSGTLGTGAVINHGTLVLNRAGELMIPNAISGSGPLTQLGPGTAVLTSANSYTGSTFISAGSLLVNNSTGSGTGSGAVFVGANGLLGGTGSIAGPLLVNAGGILSPGDGVGTFTVSTSATLSEKSRTQLEISKAQSITDVLVVNGPLIYGGTLAVTNLGGSLELGDTFRLFVADAYSGAFETYELPTLSTGLRWDTSGLTILGTITVVADVLSSNEPPPSAPTIATQPESQVATVGSSATFRVIAEGTAPLTYQWRFDGVNIAGANEDTLVIPAVDRTNAGTYSVFVASPYGSATSADAVLTVVQSQTFSGRATVLSADILGVKESWSDTGELPSSGGALDSSALRIREPDLISGDVGHAAVIGQSDRTHSEASVASVSISLPGVAVKADFVMASASAVWRPEGTTLQGSSEIVGLTVNGEPVTVSSELNQRIHLLNGSVVINEQTTNANRITTRAIRVSIAGASEVIVCSASAGIEVQTLPDCAGEDYITGGGWITGTPTGATAHFGVSAGVRDGDLSGHLTYKDQGSAVSLKATAITSYEVVNSSTRRVEGVAEVNGVAGITFAAELADNGTGRNDTFVLHLSSGYSAAGTLGGGNLRLHLPCK